MLTKPELEYFDNLQNYIKKTLGIGVKILPCSHSFIIGDSDILGCCHKFKDGEGNLVKYLITIDDDYIHRCLQRGFLRYSPYNIYSLVETICHELAHLFIWEHGEEHTQLTQEFTNIFVQQVS